MSLQLDTRQRAMLQEMGVHVWWPESAALLSNTEQADAHSESEATAPPFIATDSIASNAYRTSLQAVNAIILNTAGSLPDGIDSMDWQALCNSLQNCQACAMGTGRRLAVVAPVPKTHCCDWMLVGDPPDIEQERAGSPFAGEAVQLLDNMLRAVGVARLNPEVVDEPARLAYLSHVLKCRPSMPRAPERAELALCTHFLRREIALTQPKVILAMGRFALQMLLSEAFPEQVKLPLGKLRQQVWRFAGVPVVVTYPPSYLLRSGQDKANAWADLCLAQEIAQAR